MEKETFKVREIILGTRKEYRKLNDYLYVLGALTSCYDTNVEQFSYKLTCYNGQKPEILCHCIQSPQTLKGLIDYLKNAIFNLTNTLEFNIQTKDMPNGLLINKEQQMLVPDEYILYFEQIVDLILKSDFANKMDFSFHFLPENSGSIVISPELFSYNVTLFNKYISLIYHAHGDYINMISDDKEYADVGVMEYLLEEDIPCNLLSEYHKKLISESNSINKTIEFKNRKGMHSNSRVRIKENNSNIIFLS